MDITKVKIDIFSSKNNKADESSTGVRVTYQLDCGGSISAKMINFATLEENKSYALEERGELSYEFM